MLADYFLLSLKSLRRRRLRSWLTMIGIFIGIAAVVSLITLGQGLRTAVTGQFQSLSTDILTVTGADTGFSPPGSTAVRKLNEHDVNVIEKVSGIKQIVPRLLRAVKVEYNKNLRFSYIVSMPEDRDKIDFIYKEMNVDTAQGKKLGEQDKGKVLLGDDFSSNIDFGKRLGVGSKILIQGREFEVIGIMQRSSTFTINSAMVILESDMKDLLDIDDEIDLIAIQVENQDEIEKVAENIKKEMRRDRDEKVGEEDFKVQTPVEGLQAVDTILNIVNIIVIGIAVISLIVGGIGIANTMYTGVLERTKEIGTMKAVGARNSDILFVFLIESGLLGLIGGIIGVILGLGMAYSASSGANAFFGNNIFDFEISWPLVIGSVVFSFLVGILSGLLPALQASKLRPVDALRG
ncbi:MAG: ABC transporter permease [archaeon]